jgi:hypothetical protein
MPAELRRLKRRLDWLEAFVSALDSQLRTQGLRIELHLEECEPTAHNAQRPVPRRAATGNPRLQSRPHHPPAPAASRHHPFRFSPWTRAHDGGLRPSRAQGSGQPRPTTAGPGQARPNAAYLEFPLPSQSDKP